MTLTDTTAAFSSNESPNAFVICGTAPEMTQRVYPLTAAPAIAAEQPRMRSPRVGSWLSAMLSWYARYSCVVEG